VSVYASIHSLAQSLQTDKLSNTTKVELAKAILTKCELVLEEKGVVKLQTLGFSAKYLCVAEVSFIEVILFQIVCCIGDSDNPSFLNRRVPSGSYFLLH